MKIVTLFDTGVATNNLGDEIIMDSVQDVIQEILPDAYLNRVPTHDYIGSYGRRLVRESALSFVGGTNLLDSNMFGRKSLWKLHFTDVFWLRSVVLLGVGWRGYRGAMKPFTRLALNSILAPEFTHSVRDSYSLTKLTGIRPRVLNTACMTMWRLTAEFCAKLPRKKADKAVTTLTFYKPEPELDRTVLETLKAHYRDVVFWPQQARDMTYFESLGVGGIEIVPPSLRAYTTMLENEDIDFIGTRLHGGIRAMQKGHRALILSVDNRAVEIARDTNLPVISRNEVSALLSWIFDAPATAIRLPSEAIGTWKAQFQ